MMQQTFQIAADLLEQAKVEAVQLEDGIAFLIEAGEDASEARQLKVQLDARIARWEAALKARGIESRHRE